MPDSSTETRVVRFRRFAALHLDLLIQVAFFVPTMAVATLVLLQHS